MEITSNQTIALQSDKGVSPPREKQEYSVSSENTKTDTPSSAKETDLILSGNSSGIPAIQKQENPQKKNLTEKLIEKEKEEKNDENINEKTNNSIVSNTFIQFKMEEVKDKETGQTSRELIILLLDKKSGDIVRRIPPEEFFDPYNKNKYSSYPILGNLIDNVG